MVLFNPTSFASSHPLDILIMLLSFAAISITGIERLRKLVVVIQIALLVLRMYKHVVPMMKHYFDTHPTGISLKRKTTVDNQLNYLIKAHQLPYDGYRLHEELIKIGAEG